MTKLSLFDWPFFKYYLGIFFVSLAVNFIGHKIQKRTMGDNLGKIMLLPYLRIIPMHLCILVPAFFSITRLTVFLVLKVVAYQGNRF
jgi:mannose/fructose/N-acetylgalactosamine-specific phosphotransferase system component IIC